MSLQLPQNATPVKINDLTVAGSVNTTDITVIVQDGVTKQATAALFLAAGDTSQTANATLSAIAAMTSAALGFMSFQGPGNVSAYALSGTTGEITVVNGGGGGAPVFSLPTALIFTGKTVSGGTFHGAALTSATIDNPVINAGSISGTTINAASLTVSGNTTVVNFSVLGSASVTGTLSAGVLNLGTALTVANGGTGANNSTSAALNLLPTLVGQAEKFLQVNAGATGIQWTSASTGGGGGQTAAQVCALILGLG